MAPRFESTSRRRAAILLLGLAPGCGGHAETPAPEDRTVVMSDAVQRYQVGGLDDSGPAFGDRLIMAFDGEGRLHVLDASNHRTVVLDSGGNVAWTFGREGRGPAEIAYAVGLAVAEDGSQVVADLGNMKLLSIDRDGELTEVASVDGDSGFPSGHTPRVGDEVVSAPDPDEFATIPDSDSLRWGIRAHAVSSERPRLVASRWRAPDPPPAARPPELGGRRIRVGGLTDLKAFWPRVLLAQAGGTLAVVDSTVYRIELLGSDGAVLGILERGVAPHPVTPAVMEAERARRRRVIEDGQGPRFQISSSDGGSQGVDQAMVDDFIVGQIEIMSFWPEIPAILAVKGAPDGTVWAQRSHEDGSAGPIDLLHVDGRYLGSLPRGTAFPAALGPDGLIAYAETSDLGVVSVRVMTWRPSL